MSPITALLSARTVEHAPDQLFAPVAGSGSVAGSAPSAGSAPLAGSEPALRGLHELVEGESATIVRLAHASDAATARRLFDLGFTPGAAVSKVRRAPFGGPSVYRVADYEIALRPTQARTITIQVVTGTGAGTDTATSAGTSTGAQSAVPADVRA